MTLVIMNLPTIMRTTQESLKTVPQSYREGAFGLGAGKWRTIRTVVLPGCVDGVHHRLHSGRRAASWARRRRCCSPRALPTRCTTACVPRCRAAGATLTVALYVYAKEQGEFDVAFAIAAILMALALLINLAAMLTGTLLQETEENL